jgi:hypothetical protein
MSDENREKLKLRAVPEKKCKIPRFMSQYVHNVFLQVNMAGGKGNAWNAPKSVSKRT